LLVLATQQQSNNLILAAAESDSFSCDPAQRRVSQRCDDLARKTLRYVRLAVCERFNGLDILGTAALQDVSVSAASRARIAESTPVAAVNATIFVFGETLIDIAIAGVDIPPCSGQHDDVWMEARRISMMFLPSNRSIRSGDLARVKQASRCLQSSKDGHLLNQRKPYSAPCNTNATKNSTVSFGG